MCILPLQQPRDSAASQMRGQARSRLALDALAGIPISHLALQHSVSRKFVRTQRDKADQALLAAFDPPAAPAELLFTLPVTKSWLRQFVVALALVCHSPYRGITDLLADLFDHPISIGTVHNILRTAASTAASINGQQDLSGVSIAALDEIFQAGSPVLVAADTRSGYCCLLSQEEHRDADTWGVRLLELQERGFAPKATIADFGSGLRAGQKQALPDVPCRADIFHPLRDFQTLSTYLDNRAYDAICFHEGLLRKQTRHVRRRVWKDRSVAMKASAAGRASQKAIDLSDEVRTLLSWWQNDVLALAADDYATRWMLHDWIVDELRTREGRCERIRTVRVLLENNRDCLLAFAEQLDADMAALAERLQVSRRVVREALAVQQMDEARPSRWQREKELWRQLGGKYEMLRKEVEKIASGVVRASSVIENLNSRLRNYFFLRKQLGSRYLGLLQFYINHHRIERSERAERQGKSPRELLSGQEQQHWLEMLGYQRFRKAAA
jgi:hypothetical protein